jgi:transforming growth factor-beta-induced protein
MTKVVRFARVCLAIVLFAAVTAAGTARSHAAQDIVDTLSRMGDFTTLLKGLQVTGLEQTLRGPGPFTVFAPTDAAFAVLEEDGKGTVAAIFAPENRAGLADLLAYHMVPGKITFDGITNAPISVRTVEGHPMELLLIISSIYANHYGRVQQAGIQASNGIIHVIDRVVAPKK